MILHESSDAIELQYGSAPRRSNVERDASIGIENASGTIGLQVAFGIFDLQNQGFLISANVEADHLDAARQELLEDRCAHRSRTSSQQKG